MKKLQILFFLIICGAGLVVSVFAQPCAGFSVRVFVKDQSFKSIENAKVEVFQLLADGPKKYSAEPEGFEEDAYRLGFSLPKLGEYFKDEFLLKVSAGGFKTGEMKVQFPDCATRYFEFILKPLNSQSEPESVELETLMGKLTSRSGKPIKSTVVRAKNENGRIYEAKTDSDGRYRINLPVGPYQLEIFDGQKSYERGKTTVTKEGGVNFLDLKL